jgi:DNA-nicking Smr family endonuclease
MKLDLHGHTIHAAYALFNSRITDAYYAKHRTVVVITGQGAIMNEFRVWAVQHPHIRSWSNNPHNPGSYKISIKKG